MALSSNKPSLTHYFEQNQSSDLTHVDLSQYALYDTVNIKKFRGSALMQALSGIYNHPEDFKLTDDQWSYLIINSTWVYKDEIFGTEIEYLFDIGLREQRRPPIDALIKCFNAGLIEEYKILSLIYFLIIKEDNYQYFSKIWPYFSEEKKLFIFNYIHQDNSIHHEFIKESHVLKAYKIHLERESLDKNICKSVLQDKPFKV